MRPYARVGMRRLLLRGGTPFSQVRHNGVRHNGGSVCLAKEPCARSTLPYRPRSADLGTCPGRVLDARSIAVVIAVGNIDSRWRLDRR